MQFAANLSLLFPTHTPWQERFERVAQQGFKGVEILFPYDHPPAFYQQYFEASQLQAVLINTPHSAGSMGYAALPHTHVEFRQSFDQALEVALALKAEAIHIMAGLFQSHSVEPWQEHLHENLSYVLTQIRGTSLRVQLEALNSQDVPDYAYADPLLLLPVLEDINDEQLGLQFDFYHTLMQGLDLLAVLERVRPYISHVQIASPQGRHEPDFEQYPELLHGLQYLQESHYPGWIGLEYRPRTSFEQSLGFLQAFLANPTD